MVEVVTTDISGAVAKLKKAGINVHAAVPKLISRLLISGERHMKQTVPVDTGYLRGSIHSDHRGEHAYILAGAEYAQYVNSGTRPHIIRPRNKKVLAFPPFGARSGYRGGIRTGIFKFGGKSVDVGLVFAKEVHHPGTKGVHFVEKTSDYILKILPVETDRIIEQALKAS